MKKKMRKFQNGGVADEDFTADQLKFLGGADRTDPYILARRGKFIPKVEFAGRVFPKGRYVVQAVGEAENWCFNSALNGNTAPVRKAEPHVARANPHESANV